MLFTADSGVEVLETLHREQSAVLVRARLSTYPDPVLIKTFQMDYPSPTEVAGLRHEYEITKQAAAWGVLVPIGLEQYRHTWMLLFEDCGGDLLQTVLAQSRLGLARFFEIALSLCDALLQLHRKQIWHRDLRPANLLIQRAHPTVKITNFSQASSERDERSRLPSESITAYRAPEQSGRMNRTVDHRSDLYAVGVILYEMLTGQLPFTERDEVKLLHQHFTQPATPPSEIDPRIPAPLSELVMKCLAKNPEDRYQSAHGLLHDLKACHEHWLADGEIESPALGAADRSEQFRISQLVYGRERELEVLHRAYEAVRLGGSASVMITGPAGIGKSTLVREAKRRIPQGAVLYLAGKFEQNKQHAPYEGVLQALRDWIRIVLAKGEGSIEWWKARLTEALGPRVTVAAEALPELQMLVGAQTPAPTLPAQETNSRFLLTILQLLRLLPTAEQPLLLFLDDLQWADSASQHLLTVLMTAQNIPNLLVIGSTREQPANPLWQQAPILQLPLSTLSATDVHHLMRDTLHRLTPEVERLAHAVTEKTGGNPFVITQFLQGLSSEGLLALEVQSGEWSWDMDAIRALQVHDSQVDFILSQISRLPVHARLLLGAAACIGTRFALEPLHHAVGGELSELSASLQTLLKVRLFETDDLQWRFAHDRIQQAAYDQVPRAERARLHLTLGRWLLEQRLEQDAEEHLYQLVHHFQQVDVQSLTPVECQSVARLQLAVAKRAKAALDFEQGLRACVHGISLLSETCWEEMYDTTFALHQERFELESLCGHRETAGELFAYLLQKAQTPLQALPIYQFRILTFYKENASAQAMKLGWEALRQFGLAKELRADRLSLRVAYLRIRRRLTSKRLQEWQALPPAADPQAIAQMEILWVMAVMMLLVDEKMMHRLILKILEISLKKGYAAPSGSAYLVYGNLVAQRGEFELGAAYGQLGVEAVTAYGKQTGVPNCQGLFNYTTNMMPFAAPMREVSRSFDTLLQQALEAGDLRVFANGLVMAVHAMLFSGQALEEVQQLLHKHAPIMQLSQNVWLLQATQFLTGLVHNLRGLAKGVDDLSHPTFDEEEYRQRTLGSRTGKGQNVQPLNYWHSKFLLQFLAGKFDQALETAETLEQECTFPRGHFVEANFQVLHALTLTQQMPNLPKPKQHDAWKKLLKLRKKVHAAAARCPANYLHKLRLLEAELARLRGRRQRAMDLYDEAIAGALAHQFWNDEGIAQEFAAHFYRQLGKTTIADSYLRAARQAYLKWGAQGKVQQMQVRDPHPFVTEESTLPRGNALDFHAVMQAAQAISSEIVLPELMAKMMRILLEHAGAQAGTLLFEAEGRWVAHDPAVEVCQAVLNYVARTGESVLLQDACREGLFRHDASLQARQVKSLLCTPMRHQAKQVGLLYLENNATANAFTAERLELLQLLSTQFAISLENAQLYENLEAKVHSRTNELEASKRQLERSVQETAKVWSEMAVLEERTRIAHELHDVIGHTLTTSIVQLESCKRIAVKKPDQVLGLVNNIQDNLRNGLQEVRVSVRMLKDNISQMELGQALEKLLHDAKTQLGLEVDHQIDPLPRLDANLRKTLYHALQEGLTNSVRHGKSTKVHFRLTLERGSIHFELQDNGRGVQAEIPGFGLTTMRERVERLGGSLQILSAPSQGFNLRVQIPMPETI